MEDRNYQREPINPPESSVVSDLGQPMPIRMLTGGIGGLIGALVGGFVWGQIVKITEYEVGYVAIGVGFLCGWAVGFFSQGGRGVPFQFIAAVTSVLGIFFGKYYAVYLILVKEYGPDFSKEVSLFSNDYFEFFREIISEVSEPIDFLFYGLAIYTAWRMLAPKPRVPGIPNP